MRHHVTNLYRDIDSARGPFAPVERPPLIDATTNPRGTRHIEKTVQDRLPVERRRRVSEWWERLSSRAYS